MAIILHSEFDKESREFVEKYGAGHTILTYPECLSEYPNISAFLSVVVEFPEKVIASYTIPEWTDEETKEIFPEEIVPEKTIEAFTDVVRGNDENKLSWEYINQLIQEYLDADPGAEYR